ncbi:MAG: branched chain amino acid aminotransferase [Candidatus Binatia bacterium]|nr:MAG: branched chain amino acid aminotransferase [Candidatus Binatia bacterium]
MNGRVVPGSRASVSAFDRGFLYADGLFETLRSYRGEPFGLDDHLDRLDRSCQVLGIRLPRTDWPGRIRKLLARNRLLRVDARVRITVTRGPAPLGLPPPAGQAPTTVVHAVPIDPTIPRAQERGGRAVLLPYTRNGFLAEHKTLDYLPAILAQPIIRRHRAIEGLYVNEKKHVTEATTANFFVVWRGRLVTPPLESILAGIVRERVLELGRAAGLQVFERPVPVDKLGEVEEAFLTSSVVEVLPIVRIDERPVGSGKVGPVTRQMQTLYRELVKTRLASATGRG